MKKLKTIFLAGLLSFNLNFSSASDSISKISYKHLENNPKNIEEIIKNYERIIFINKSKHELILYEDGKKFKEYSIATGKNPRNKTNVGQWSTPEGIFRINKKRKVKSYNFGTRVIGLDTNYLGFDGIYIHGTYDKKSIGTNASHGCVRMKNKDIEEIYRLIHINDVVIIIP